MRDFPKILFLHQCTRQLFGVPLNADEWPDSWKKVEFKEYPRMQKIILPKADPLAVSLQKTLERRQSARDFNTRETISSAQLSTLLYWSAGIRKNREQPEISYRFYPSGGARYPLEIYFYFQGNSEIPEGLYHYNVKKHILEQLLRSEAKNDVMSLITYLWAYSSPLFFFITGVFDRSMRKYQERGYRFVLIEAGVLLHNFYLVSTALDLCCCAIGSPFDERVEKMLDVEPTEESFITAFVVGLPKY